MHEAVAAMLNNPELSLCNALKLSGFHFPKINKNNQLSTYGLEDSDGELIGQWKNQLFRRVKEAKHEVNSMNNKTTDLAIASATF